MTKNKDEQIKELKKHKDKGYNVAYVVNVFWAILMLVAALFFLSQIIDLENQLQSCQEKVDVWTLKVECDYDWEDYEYISYELVLNNYEEYLNLLEELEDDYCKVIG